jgi:hypothetical protein
LAASHWNPIVAAACAAMVFAVAALYALRAVLVRLGGDVAIGAAALVINVVALADRGQQRSGVPRGQQRSGVPRA